MYNKLNEGTVFTLGLIPKSLDAAVRALSTKFVEFLSRLKSA